jgi:hypothetical protein
MPLDVANENRILLAEVPWLDRGPVKETWNSSYGYHAGLAKGQVLMRQAAAV